jgi:hypothetical protein
VKTATKLHSVFWFKNKVFKVLSVPFDCNIPAFPFAERAKNAFLFIFTHFLLLFCGAGEGALVGADAFLLSEIVCNHQS